MAISWLLLVLLLALFGVSVLVAIVVGLVILLTRKKKQTAEHSKKDTPSG